MPRPPLVPTAPPAAGKKRGPKRSGTLDYTKRDGWIVIVPTKAEGVTLKKRYRLGTHDERVARAKMVRFVADLDAGRIAPEHAAEDAVRAELLHEACERVQKDRQAAGMADAGNSLGRLRRYAYAELRDPATVGSAPFPCLGRMEVTKIKTTDVNVILDYCRRQGKSRETLKHLRQDLANVFAALMREGAIETNPVDRAELPVMPKAVKKQRAVVSDDELRAYLAYEHPQEHWRMAILETQTMSCVSRMFGGIRTGDLHALRWESFDVEGGRFGWGLAPRQKTKQPQKLAVPEMLRPILRDWWERHGRPLEGLLFPARRGERIGKTKIKVSHARAFRRDLKRAFGIERWDPEQQKYVIAREMTPRERELFIEGPFTLPADFHSWRRSYSQALAEAGVNAQIATALAGHASLAAHARYLANADAMRAVPEAALPKLWVETVAPPDNSETGRQLLPVSDQALTNPNDFSGADGTRTRGLRRDRPLEHDPVGVGGRPFGRFRNAEPPSTVQNHRGLPVSASGFAQPRVADGGRGLDTERPIATPRMPIEEPGAPGTTSRLSGQAQALLSGAERLRLEAMLYDLADETLRQLATGDEPADLRGGTERP